MGGVVSFGIAVLTRVQININCNIINTSCSIFVEVRHYTCFNDVVNTLAVAAVTF